MILGKAVFVDAVILETGFRKYIRYLVEMLCDILGLMSIGTDSYYLTAKFAVSLKRGHAGMELLHAFAHGFGIDLDSLFVFDKMLEDLIDDIAVF